MSTIEIDFDVYKALTLRRTSEEVTYNDVLRQLLNLTTKKGASVSASAPLAQGEWIAKGVLFPAGTEFRGSYKGRTFMGKVESGALHVDGKQYDSPSAAAVAITGNPVNGWLFWECRFPGSSSWVMIKSLRK